MESDAPRPVIDDALAARAHEALVRRLYAAFGAGDRAALGELLAADVGWHVPGHGPLAGDYRGLAAILGYFEQLHERSAGSFRAEVRAIAGSASGCLVHASTRATRLGRHLALDYVMVFAIAAGRIESARLFSADLYAFDAFWGD